MEETPSDLGQSREVELENGQIAEKRRPNSNSPMEGQNRLARKEVVRKGKKRIKEK